MRRVLHGVDTVSEWTGKGLSTFILIVMGLLLFEITLRYVFNAPTIWVHETSQHLFGAYSVLAGAYVLFKRQHISVDVIYRHFSPRTRAILDLVTSIMFFLFVGTILVYGVQMALHSIELRETSISPWHPPVYPVKCLVPLGAFLILLQGLAHFIRALSMAVRGRELA